MNLFASLLFCILLFLILFWYQQEPYMNYMKPSDPMGPSTSNDAAEDANQHYASLLLYLQQNPQKSIKFIEDIKKKFFEKDTKVRSDIDFANLLIVEGGSPF